MEPRLKAQVRPILFHNNDRLTKVASYLATVVAKHYFGLVVFWLKYGVLYRRLY